MNQNLNKSTLTNHIRNESSTQINIIPVSDVIIAEQQQLIKHNIYNADATKTLSIRPIYAKRKKNTREIYTNNKKNMYPPDEEAFNRCKNLHGPVLERVGINREHQPFKILLASNPVISPNFENCRRGLKTIRFLKVNEVIQYVQQQKHNDRKKRIQRYKEIHMLQKKIKQYNLMQKKQQVKLVLNRIYTEMKTFLLNSNNHLYDKLPEKYIAITNVILHKLCDAIGYLIPERTSKNFYDKFILNLADNLAIWVNTFENDSKLDLIEVNECEGYDGNMEKEKETNLENTIGKYPIDDYISCSTDDASSISAIEPSISNNEVKFLYDGETKCMNEIVNDQIESLVKSVID